MFILNQKAKFTLSTCIQWESSYNLRSLPNRASSKYLCDDNFEAEITWHQSGSNLMIRFFGAVFKIGPLDLPQIPKCPVFVCGKVWVPPKYHGNT